MGGVEIIAPVDCEYVESELLKRIKSLAVVVDPNVRIVYRYNTTYQVFFVYANKGGIRVALEVLLAVQLDEFVLDSIAQNLVEDWAVARFIRGHGDDQLNTVVFDKNGKEFSHTDSEGKVKDKFVNEY